MSATTNPAPDFYTCDDQVEELVYTDPDEAIENHLDDVHSLAEAMLEPLKVYAYRRTPITDRRRAYLGEAVLEFLLEALDENSPEESTEPTEPMKAAARTFVDSLLELYNTWACEKVGEETVDAAAWVAQHRPDWLAEPGR